MLSQRRSRLRVSGAIILSYCLIAVSGLMGVAQGIRNINDINLLPMHELAIHSSLLRGEAEMLVSAAARSQVGDEWQTYVARITTRIASIKGTIRLIRGGDSDPWRVVSEDLAALQEDLGFINGSLAHKWPQLLNRFSSHVNSVVVDLHKMSELTGANQTIALRTFATSVLILSTMLAVLGLLAIFLLLRLRHQNLELLRISNEDGLTGLASRRHAQRKGLEACKQAQDQNSVVSLAILDIDHFKSINDTFGHTVGDDVICYVARSLQQLDIGLGTCARVGGEEFLLILPDAKLSDTVSLCEALQRDLREKWCLLGVPPTTVSIGIASGRGNSADFFKLYQQADSALYSAKRSGRNRIAIHDAMNGSDFPPPSHHHAQPTLAALRELAAHGATSVVRRGRNGSRRTTKSH